MWHKKILAMYKVYFRFLMALLKKDETIISYKYFSNLKVFSTEKVKFVLVNDLKAKSVWVYYYYLPEKIFINRVEYTMPMHHRHTFATIKKEIRKITEDENYRQYYIQFQRNHSRKNGRRERYV